MKISYKWLRELIPFDMDVSQLADRLTYAGVEVEAVEELDGPSTPSTELGTGPLGDRPSTPLGASDWRLELEVTPNRPDCLSLLGIAREIRALCGGEIVQPDCLVSEAGADANSLAKIIVEDKEGCPRYVARVITGVKVAESPEWLRDKIESVGLRPINNVADVTNLVLYELGHPLHAFDLDRLADRTIVVRRAKAGEPLTTLDGVERKLSPEHLVIADAKRPVALAGIMGGADSEISGSTRNVLLESAYFDPRLIRRGGRALGLKSDASYRFERGADPLALERTADRAARLIAEVAGGQVAKGRIDVSARKFPESWQVELRPERAEKLLGIRIPVERMLEILRALEIGAIRTGDKITATVPSFRRDLEREVDLIEEIARVHGYDKLPDDHAPVWSVPARTRPKDQNLRAVSQAMAGLGFSEHYGLPMSDPERLQNLFPKSEPVRLANPMSSELSVLRPSLLPGLLEALAFNRNNGTADVRLFEAGLVYLGKGEQPPEEKPMLGAVAIGNSSPVSWDRNPRVYDFFDLKGDLESLMAALGLEAETSKADGGAPSWPYRGRAAAVVLGRRTIGYAGELDPGAAAALGIEGRACCLEVGLAPVLEAMEAGRGRYAGIPRHQAVRRDLAVSVAEGTDYGAVKSAIMEAGRPELESAELFDLYRGEQAGPGRKSLAIALRYRPADRPAADLQAAQAQQRIVVILGKRFGAEIR
ncbi:MAG TPA: phenylalanine--tRNA ligase subunit beta [candidate division Zixibacteria bacterium]|nr:phenylalanine--tRNA ligase subunit beta [candidate division Zixibacteria bacterium]